MRREEKGVIITVYVESSTIPSRSNGPTDPRKANKARNKYGYDRRAQLLAHARRLRLRHAADYYDNFLEGSKTNRGSRSRSKSKPKKKSKWRWRWRWKPSSAKLRRSFRRFFRKREKDYARVETETINCNKRKGTSTTWGNSIFWGRLTRMVKGCYGQHKNVY